MIKTQAFKVEPEFKSPALNVLLKIGCYNMLGKDIHTGLYRVSEKELWNSSYK
jgi:hypothetical protein